MTESETIKQYRKPNKLINEKSPYLLQHAYNPVNWNPWGEEAFALAKAQDKPIFLSIGYSTCHWCHVMEKESFENEEVAAILNRYFISIKVDREERPDVDSIYMSVCQSLTGSGGWPLTIFMTSDKKPFYAGTYFPRESMRGMPGIKDVLISIAEQWNENKESIIESSKKIVEHIKKNDVFVKPGEMGESEIHNAFSSFESVFDDKYGGFGRSPKFPAPHNLQFLLRYWKNYNEPKALEIVETTLEAMYAGGIFDHIGFGFSRYSTDQKWLVPHFEKMLYDNALLAQVYIEAFEATGKKFYKEVADKIFTYILRDMTSKEGAFYSAEDADSEGIEGKYYLLTYKEVALVLGEENCKIYCEQYDITQRGNFDGRNIPNLIGKQSSTNIDEETERKLEKMREKLFKYREKRIHPYKDDKILTSWNGLMIAALTYGGRVFQNTSYINVAEKAMNFILSKMINDKGRLMARYRDGDVAHLGYLDDYAFTVHALIELYEVTFNSVYLTKAIELNENMIKLFKDQKQGGFFLYGVDGEELISRPKDIYDGAMPSGNSVATLNMLRLARLTANTKLQNEAALQFKVFASKVKTIESAHAYFMTALLYSEVPGKDIIIAGEMDAYGTKAMIKEINSTYLPFSTVVLNAGDGSLNSINSELAAHKPLLGKTTAYICENYTCREPITNLQEFSESINE
ncbi:thioredoxin domain-containing protein [Clostridium estertheticum]|uniref:Thioredoxin domain-containing protein n=1 Tax=Clostridium estertheticum TaxID=238834 RepID=A0A5N7IR82_9CLOT|nr:thioredoxin domain-containing protein [Clostridium estertheticum]MPQ32823.1 thioredoxin domain-containing protein [Clostridium estertheticum]MPQ63482.1 thioredoxin domain-containing protein [Clostridium estertheticum]